MAKRRLVVRRAHHERTADRSARPERVEERRDLEPFLAEAGIVREREAEIPGAHDGDAEFLVETEDLAEVALQVAHVIAHAAPAALTEVGEVLPNLRRVQMELIGQRLRGDRPHACVLEHVQASQIDGQTIRRELRHLIGALASRGRFG